MPVPSTCSSPFRLAICLCILALSWTSAVRAQLVSVTDAEGNVIVETIGIGLDGLETTSTIETIPFTSSTVLAPAPEPAPTMDPNAPPEITLGQAGGPPTTTGSRPPVTYIRFETIDGVQVRITDTFTATTPTPSTTIQPGKGSILDIATYLPPPPSTTSSGTAHQSLTQFSRSNAQVAALGLLLSMILGAVALL